MEIFLLLMLACAVHGGCVVKDPVCYVDDAKRILGHDNVNYADGLSNEWCAQLCHTNGFGLAGTEFSSECYCGNSVRSDAEKAPASQCNMACKDYPSEKCGGNYRISIFNVSCSGTPVPPPPIIPELINPCLNQSQPYHKMPWCDFSLPIDTRVGDMVSRMTLDEKISNLVTGGAPINSLGLPRYNWWSEATHGVASARLTTKTPYMTNFAFPITTAMAFNRSLWQKTGEHIGREARAFMNAGNAFSTFWAPVINLAREPRWGRNIETPGEDPYLTGEYATYFVRGMQESPDDETHIQASACCKHYVANSMESSTVAGVHHWRNEFDATVTAQDLVDSYMLPFQACVEKGKVTGLMCSYNAVNGVPSCANDWLLTTVARDDWGFDGYVTSDCDADADVFNNHHYTATPEETVRDVLRAGTDVDCGGFVQQHAQSALDKGVITVDDIDVRLKYLFRVRMRLSHFDPKGPLNEIPTSTICSDYGVELSFDGAAQGSTLLKNEHATLPLAKGTTVAVIGPNAMLSEGIAGYYGPSHVCNNSFYTMVDAVSRFGHAVYKQGVPSVKSKDTSLIPAAVAAAGQADDVVLVVGTDLSIAAEGHDATGITMSDAQLELVSRVAAASKKPVTVVLLTAVPLDISAILSNDKVGAVMHVGQPSVTVYGVGAVLYGDKVPAGRMVQTILPASYADSISIFDFNMRPGPSAWPRPDCTKPAPQCPNGTNPGRTHRFYTGKAVVPFGFGLSYTTFAYALVQTPSSTVSGARTRVMLDKHAMRDFVPLAEIEKPLTSYVINVTNTGKVDADDVVLGFIVPPGAGTNGVPLQTLFGFERVHVKAGETVTVWLYPSLGDLTLTDDAGSRRLITGEYTVRFGLPDTATRGQGYAEHTFSVY